MDHANLVSLNENLLAAVDVETTGIVPWFHEIIQIAIVPLDLNLRPVGDPFYTNVRPEFPERASKDAFKTHGITMESLQLYPDKHEVQEALWDWFERLELLPKKRVVPLVHNAHFDIPFIQAWMGHEYYKEIFGYPVRDTMSYAQGLVDKAAFKGQVFELDRVSLARLCEVLAIDLVDAHDALADAIATAAVYRGLFNLHT